MSGMGWEEGGNAKIPGIDAGWKERKKGRSEDCELAKWFYQTGQRAVAVAARWRVLWHVGRGPLQEQTRSRKTSKIKKNFMGVRWLGLYYFCSIRSAHLPAFAVPLSHILAFSALCPDPGLFFTFYSCVCTVRARLLDAAMRGKERKNAGGKEGVIGHLSVVYLAALLECSSTSILYTTETHRDHLTYLHRHLPKDGDRLRAIDVHVPLLFNCSVPPVPPVPVLLSESCSAPFFLRLSRFQLASYYHHISVGWG